MKRTFLFAAALAVLSLASCKKDDKPQIPTDPDEPEVTELVNTDANNWKLYSGGFYEGVSSETMTEVEEGDTKCLKWVFASDAAWGNYGVLNIDPFLNLKDADADKACLTFNFKVEKDGGPVAQHTLFRVYFGSSDGSNAKDVWVGGIGRGEASLEWYDIVVNDNEWHKLTLPLKNYIADLSGVGSARQLGFTPKDAPAAVGTTVLFKDIRLENCAVSYYKADEPSVDPNPDPDTPKEFTALIYDDAISGTWVLDGTAGKFTETTDEHSSGTKSVKWYCESAWFNSACVFRLPKGETKDISSYSKLKFDVKITATGNEKEHAFEPGDEAFTIRTYSDGTAEYSESYYIYCARTTAEGGEGDWHTVEIPIKTSTDPNDKWNCFVIQGGSGAYPFKNFNQFCFHNMDWSGNAGNIYIDNVTLVK